MPVQPEAELPEWPAQDRQLAWKTWSAAALQEAVDRDSPVLLYLAAPGYEGLFSGKSALLQVLIEERFVGVQVNPFIRPDIARRYPTGGWPALVALLPDSRAFAVAVDIPAENVELFLLRLLDAYRENREVVESQVAAATRGMKAKKHFALDIEQLYQDCVASFDVNHGGFGQGAKFIEAGTLGFLLKYATMRQDEQAWQMVEQTLDALLASPLLDRQHGGVYAFSHTPDWQTPAREKDGVDQAALLQVLLAAATRRPDYAKAARSLLDYIADQLFDAHRGTFRGRQLGMGEDRWWDDPIIYADRHTALLRACVAAAHQLDDERAAQMARSAAVFLSEHCIDEAGAVHRLCDRSGVRGLLEDQALASLALLEMAQLTGEEHFAQAAQATRTFLENQLFEPRLGAFVDRPAELALAGWPRQPITPYSDGLLPAGNALAAELYVQLGAAQQARRLLRGKRFVDSRSGRSRSSAARIALKLDERE